MIAIVQRAEGTQGTQYFQPIVNNSLTHTIEAIRMVSSESPRTTENQGYDKVDLWVYWPNTDHLDYLELGVNSDMSYTYVYSWLLSRQRDNAKRRTPYLTDQQWMEIDYHRNAGLDKLIKVQRQLQSAREMLDTAFTDLIEAGLSSSMAYSRIRQIHGSYEDVISTTMEVLKDPNNFISTHSLGLED